MIIREEPRLLHAFEGWETPYVSFKKEIGLERRRTRPASRKLFWSEEDAEGHKFVFIRTVQCHGQDKATIVH